MVKNVAARPDSAAPSRGKFRGGKDQLSFWVRRGLHKQVKAQAKREGVPMSNYIEALLIVKLKEVREASRGLR